MKLLAIDTATEACSVALWLDGTLHEHYEIAGREHSARLPGLLQALLAEAGIRLSQVDGLVAGVGPGSFAGVRIGVAFVKGLALGLDRPATGISSLRMLAQGAIRMTKAGAVLAAIDARMNEVYIGAFESIGGLAESIGSEQVTHPEQLTVPELRNFVAVGSGWQAWREVLSQRLTQPPMSMDATALPHARDALILALPRFIAGDVGDASQLIPNYLRNNVALTQLEQSAARLLRHAAPPRPL